MKSILLGLILPLGLSSQSFTVLSGNDCAVGILGNGDISYGAGSSGGSNFEIPEGSGNHTIFSSTFWMGGVDQNGQFHGAYQTYRTENNEYYPGPVSSNYSEAYDQTYNRLWILNKSDIDSHIANYDSPNYQMNESILTWPGNGNTVNGESTQLAPFQDINNNGQYEPELGDYPIIKGDHACLFIANNDRLATDYPLSGFTPSGSQNEIYRTGIEIIGMLYQYSSNITALNQTTFASYQFRNKSDFDYADFYLGSFVDFDLGDYSDDFIGTDSLLNSIYAYNGDSYDSRYGDTPPAQSLTLLNNSLDGSMYYQNMNNIYNGNPTSVMDSYKYLKNTWLDGTPVTYGGSGYDLESDNQTNFMFTGNPNENNSWSESSEGNVPSDRRMLANMGPMSFEQNETKCFDFAYVFGRGSDNLNSVTILKENIQFIQEFYDENISECMDFVGVENYNKEMELTLSPNPVKNSFTIEGLQEGNIVLFDITGQMVKSIAFSGESIDVSNLSDGIYILQVESNDKQYSTRVLIHK